MSVRADMNIVEKGSLFAVGDVYFDEMVVIHNVKALMAKDEDGKEKLVVVMPSKKRGEEWQRVVSIKDQDLYWEVHRAVIENLDYVASKDAGNYKVEFEIRLFEKGDTKAYATMIFNDAVQIDGIRIYERDGKLSISYPFDQRDGFYQNLAGPATHFMRECFENRLLEAYKAKREEDEPAREEQEELPFENMEMRERSR